MIKLVVSDLDGTMFDKSCVVPEEAVALVRRLHENNILFSIASGRADSAIRAIAQKLGVHCPYVTSNGSTIVQEGASLRRVEFPLRWLRAACERADELKHSVIYTVNGEERITAVTPLLALGMQEGRCKLLPFTQEEWETLSIEKLLVWDEQRNGSICEISSMISEIGELALVQYGQHAIEVTERTVSKATGLAALTELLHVEISEVLMIGDDRNDIEVLKLAGIGAAVGNAKPEVKAVADYVCEGTHFQGIKEAVERFCFGETV